MGGIAERLDQGVSMLILKIGGGRGINIEGVAQDLATVSEPVIVVHGANAWRDELAAKLGVAVEVVSSVRGYDSVLSTEASLDVLMMAYAGLRNKRIVEAFQRHQIRAVGLSGLDGRSIQGRRNSGIQCPQGEKIVIRRDLSGKPRQVNAELLGLLLSHGYVPVLTVPISDENGFAISADNDDVVTALHATFRASTIVSMIEAPGFLKDAADPSSLPSR